MQTKWWFRWQHIKSWSWRIGLIVLVFGFVFGVYPLAFLWFLNMLGFEISYTWKTYIGALGIYFLFGFSHHNERNR